MGRCRLCRSTDTTVRAIQPSHSPSRQLPASTARDHPGAVASTEDSPTASADGSLQQQQYQQLNLPVVTDSKHSTSPTRPFNEGDTPVASSSGTSTVPLGSGRCLSDSKRSQASVTFFPVDSSAFASGIVGSPIGQSPTSGSRHDRLMKPPNILESEEAAVRQDVRREYINETRPTTTSSSKPAVPSSESSSSPLSSRVDQSEGPNAGYVRAHTPVRTGLIRVFIFVNPTSGGNAAGAFTKAGLTQARTKDPDVEFNIFDIRDGTSGAKPGFEQLRHVVENTSQHVFVVMAGGDGTVLWGISELWEHGIDDTKVSIGVIPYGTGNDFARAMSWSKFNALNPFNEDMQSLTSLCHEWLNAPVVLHDLWSIVVEIESPGTFKQIDSKTRNKRVLLDKSGANLMKLEKKLCNYFSIGIESRIGVGFDRNRSANQFRNKIVYVNEGIKKQFLHHGFSVAKMVQKFTVFDEGENHPFVVFDNEDPEQRHLYRCSSLIASNIPSYASGLDLWKFARRYGLKKTGTRLKDDADVQLLMKQAQYMGDMKLEWISFSGIMSLGMEQLIEGMGKRVHQGKGPFVLDFYKQPPETRVYFQIDGEFYQMTEPVRLTIRHFKQVNCLASSVSDRAVTRTASA